jgi:hypothetical protein
MSPRDPLSPDLIAVLRRLKLGSIPWGFLYGELEPPAHLVGRCGPGWPLWTMRLGIT